MRTAPVNFAAASATPKLVIVNPGKRLQLLAYLTFGNVLGQSVAIEAARERRQRRHEAETTDDLRGLLDWLLRTGAIAVADNAVHQEAAVAGEQRSVFALHRLKKSAILRLAGVSDIEAKKAQVAGQLPQMTISDKFCYVPALKAFVNELVRDKSNGININRAIVL